MKFFLTRRELSFFDVEKNNFYIEQIIFYAINKGIGSMDFFHYKRVVIFILCYVMSINISFL